MLAETARLLGEVKGLQKGYTTGTTAQGACKGAAELLISGDNKGQGRSDPSRRSGSAPVF
jgi:hypothetical protein